MSAPTRIEEGHYARKQLASSVWLMKWSHQRRFRIALDLAAQFAGKSIMDYGSGDGTFLALQMATPFAAGRAVGVEIAQPVVDECNQRFAQIQNLRFVHAASLLAGASDGSFDALFCMEVLEHIVDREPLLNCFEKLLKPGGQLVISVPVETGLPLLVKQLARRLAAMRGMRDYQFNSRYMGSELLATIFAGSSQHIVRKTHTDPHGNPSYDHKGFNWMRLRKELSRQFHFEQTVASPLTFLSPHLGSQAWLICRTKVKRA